MKPRKELIDALLTAKEAAEDQLRSINNLLESYQNQKDYEDAEIKPVFRNGSSVKMIKDCSTLKNFKIGGVYKIRKFMDKPNRGTFGKYSIKNEKGEITYVKKETIEQYFTST